MTPSASDSAPLSIDALLEDPDDMRARFTWDITKNTAYNKRSQYYEQAMQRLQACSEESIFRMGRIVDGMGDEQRRRILYDIAKVSPNTQWSDTYMTLLEGVVDLEPAHPEPFQGPHLMHFANGLKLMSPVLTRVERADESIPVPIKDDGVEEIALLRFAIQAYSASEFRHIYATRHCGDVTGTVIVTSNFEDLIRKHPDQVDGIVNLLCSGITDADSIIRRLNGLTDGKVTLSLSDGWL